MAATKSLCALNIGQLSAMTPGSISPAEIDMPLFLIRANALGSVLRSLLEPSAESSVASTCAVFDSGR
jgi:hypothetical protein